jgi:hypothetical protein
MNPRVTHPTKAEIRHMAKLTVNALAADQKGDCIFDDNLTNAAEYIYFKCLRDRTIVQRAMLPGRPLADKHIDAIVRACKFVRRANTMAVGEEPK